MKILHGIVLSISAFILVTGDNLYRYDYEYSNAANGWFKFHRTPTTWLNAELRCYLEGAVLASPLNMNMELMVRVTKNHQAEVQFGMHTGINNFFNEDEYATVEGVPLSKMPIKTNEMFSENYMSSTNCVRLFSNRTLIAANCMNSLPFMCFKKKTVELKITECGTVDKDYYLDNRTGHCYKFHKQGGSWSLAYLTCIAEGGHLAIINSAVEADVLKHLFAKYPANAVTSEYKDGVLLGYLDSYKYGIWRTIKGQGLEEAGYAQWSSGETNYSFHQRDKQDHCGGMLRSGLLTNMFCNLWTPFICEKEPRSQQTNINEVPK